MSISACYLLRPRKYWQSLIKHHQFSTAGSVKKRICIVGGGTAGFYAAQYILKQISDCHIDVIEKLPVPFGLVRFGVAPDHPEVKNVINTFTKTAENDRFRYLGNLTLGRDFTLQQLRDNYHAVLLTYGADKDRRLDIPNEDHPNVLSARKFVAWYNGLPGAELLNPDLSAQTVTIVGQGNVAIDVARMLLSPLDALKQTDTTEYALEALSRSRIERVYMVGRRGPLQAAFTIKELREMLKLPNVETRWKSQDFVDIPAQLEGLQRPRKRLTELMLKSLNEQQHSAGGGKKQFMPVFLRAPRSIDPDAYQMEFTVTQLENNTAKLTEEVERIPADMVLRSIGYKSTCVDGGICFDDNNGNVLNKNGRVLKPDQSIDKGVYTAGWLATGPTGVILNTMNGAFAVAKMICDDILSGAIDTHETKAGISVHGKRVVTWQGWQRIDQAEIAAGKAKGKPREKIVSIEEMLKVAGV